MGTSIGAVATRVHQAEPSGTAVCPNGQHRALPVLTCGIPPLSASFVSFQRGEFGRARVDVEVAAAGAKGHGVFALRDFVRGETVIVGKAIGYPPRRTRMSVQVNWGRHVEMDAPATLLNHSCAPNLGVRENEWHAYDFVALRDILAGEELAFDYAMTEHSLVAPLSCCCGSEDCQGAIRPWSHRDDGWREQNAKWLAPYLRITSVLSTAARETPLARR